MRVVIIESLDDYAQRMAIKNENNTEIRDHVNAELALAYCCMCFKRFQYYTSRKGNTYLANPDLSPHRKGLDCVQNWEEYERR